MRRTSIAFRDPPRPAPGRGPNAAFLAATAALILAFDVAGTAAQTEESPRCFARSGGYSDLRPARRRPGGHYRLAEVDLGRRVIWGAVAQSPDGGALSFGGQDQQSEDGRPHTCILHDGKWLSIHRELRRANPLQGFHHRVWAMRGRQQRATARARYIFFQGRGAAEQARRSAAAVAPIVKAIAGEAGAVAAGLGSLAGLDAYHAGQARRAAERLEALARRGGAAAERAGRAPDRESIAALARMRVALEQVSELLDGEPPARAQSPLVYDRQSGLYVLFGGDHLDYLTNDTWVFDPARRQWRQRHPPSAPPPRAGHVAQAGGDGAVTVTGGYVYTSSTDYVGHQYREVADGPWRYDVARNRWSGRGGAVPPDRRTYRTGPFAPDHFLQGPRPDAAATAKRLAALPANRWVSMAPPYRPQLNRDWGTASLDRERGIILRWSGGHVAHGGTDVLHYHMATNRWELPVPVEFPLGQLYANWSYPEGFNFNRRPWMTAHSYQSYGYDLAARKMLFAGRRGYSYVYDPGRADWTGREPKPRGMDYRGAYYSLTLTQTGSGLVAWTGGRDARTGRLFRYSAETRRWRQQSFRGAPLPAATTDNASLAYDSKRDRLIFAARRYGTRFDGRLYALDLGRRAMMQLSPDGARAAAAIPWVGRLAYDPGNDLVLVGATLPPDSGGLRRTPAYDPADNRWISLAVGGPNPSGARGSNVSLGLIYDESRGLWWAVDSRSRVFVLRLDAKTADPRPLR